MMNFLVGERVDRLGAAGAVVDPVDQLADVGNLGFGLQHLVDLLAQALRRPPEVDFEDLPDVHP